MPIVRVLLLPLIPFLIASVLGPTVAITGPAISASLRLLLGRRLVASVGMDLEPIEEPPAAHRRAGQ
jgi:hypothetical protein